MLVENPLLTFVYLRAAEDFYARISIKNHVANAGIVRVVRSSRHILSQVCSVRRVLAHDVLSDLLWCKAWKVGTQILTSIVTQCHAVEPTRIANSYPRDGSTEYGQVLCGEIGIQSDQLLYFLHA